MRYSALFLLLALAAEASATQFARIKVGDTEFCPPSDRLIYVPTWLERAIIDNLVLVLAC